MVSMKTKQATAWNQILKMVSNKVDKHTFECFFEGIELDEVTDNQVTLVVPSSLAKQFFSHSADASNTLKDAISNVYGHDYQNISYLTPDEAKLLRNHSELKKVTSYGEPQTNSHFFSNCKINPNYTFDNFVVGDCNRDAVRASLLIANSPGVAYNPLFIYSKSGLGKTHLLHSIANFYLEKHPNAKVLYITSDAFIDEFVKYVKGSQESQSLKDYFSDVDLLLVDDIQFLSDKTKTAEMFFYIFSQLFNSGHQIVLTSDRHPKDLKGLEERLVSRFYMGLSVNMQSPDTDTLLEILKRKIVSRGLDLKKFDPEGLIFIAEKFSHNVRELEGALNRLLFSLSSNENKYVSLDEVKATFSYLQGIESNDKKNLSEDDVIDEVARYYHLNSEIIKSKNRKAQVALARRIAMYLCRYLLQSSLKTIGKVFSRDHSTVITAVSKVEKELKTNTLMLKAVSDIKKSLKAA